MKTKKKKPVHKPTPLQLARRAMKRYIQTTAQKAAISEKQSQAKKELLAFGSSDHAVFDGANLTLGAGYLHIANETVIKPCQGFDFSLFVKEFPGLVDKKFKVAPMKALLQDDDGKKKLLENHCVELQEVKTLEIVIDKKS